MIAALLAAASPVLLVMPLSPRGDAPEWAGFGVASAVTARIASAPQSTWVSTKQLDAVLRRRDLRMSDASDPANALALARTLGASEVIYGELELEDGKWHAVARRVQVGTQKELRAAQADASSEVELAGLAAKLTAELVDKKLGAAPTAAQAKAFAPLARCEMGLVRHSLRPKQGTLPPIDDAPQVGGECKAALDADPQSGAARAGLATLLALDGKNAEARALAQEAHKAQYVTNAYLVESFAARRAGDAAGARKILEGAVKARPGDLHALGYLAEDRMDVEDWKAALALWEQYLKRAPDHPFALGQKAHALARLGKMKEAMAFTRRALDFDHDDPELLIELGSRQIDAGQDSEAEATLRQALEAYPPRPLARLRLGYLYLRQHRAADARDMLTEAVTDSWREDESRTRGYAFADLARVAGMEGKLKEAVEYLQASRAEGAPKQLPCDAPELKAFKGKAEFDAICGAR